MQLPLYFQTISHETCHLFGLQHCVYFRCAMNGSDSMALALAQPLVCCPFCLRKMQYVCGFSLRDYYTKLRAACDDIKNQFPSKYMTANLIWLEEAIKYIEDIKCQVG